MIRLPALALIALVVVSSCRASSTLSRRDQGLVLLQTEKPDEALPLLESEHRESPGDLTIARALVEAHVKLGRVDGLIAS